MPPVVAIGIASIACAVFVAYHRGGPPERLAATIIVAWMVSDVSYHLAFGPSGFDNVDPVHIVLDGAELVAIMWLALRANRMWPLWAAAAQLICVSGHIAASIEVTGMRRAYWAMTQLPAYIQLLALVLGVVAHARRFERIGPYRSWRYT
jgi:hypothetical protein